jgi:hypothetical protein
MKTLVPFTRWCLDEKGRTPVAVDPSRVDCVEFFCDEMKTPHSGDFPAAAKIIMKGKQEYVVQGSVADVVFQLNKGN